LAVVERDVRLFPSAVLGGCRGRQQHTRAYQTGRLTGHEVFFQTEREDDTRGWSHPCRVTEDNAEEVKSERFSSLGERTRVRLKLLRLRRIIDVQIS